MLLKTVYVQQIQLSIFIAFTIFSIDSNLNVQKIKITFKLNSFHCKWSYGELWYIKSINIAESIYIKTLSYTKINLH